MANNIALERIEELNRSIGFLDCIMEMIKNNECENLANSFFKSKIDFIYKMYLRDSYQELRDQEFNDHSFYVAIDSLFLFKEKNISNEKEIESIIEAIEEMISDYKSSLFIS